MLKDFFSLIFPKTCLGCQRTLTSEEDYLCLNCKIDLPFTNDIKNPTNKLHQKFAFEHKVKSATSFLYFQRKGIVQNILHEIKYRGKKELGVLLGKMFAGSLTELNADIMIPVPLHKSKMKKRGYNQSEQIALGIYKQLGIEVGADLITRQIATKTQTQKSRPDRWVNMQNVYSKCSEDLTGMSVLIVDDVITTGATVGMLCQRLVEANVKEIHIVSIARGK